MNAVIFFVKDDGKNIGFYFNLSRMVMYTAQCISQAIVIWLFIKFSKAPKIQDDSDSEGEYEFDNFRDPKIDMLYYTKNMNIKIRPTRNTLTVSNRLPLYSNLYEETETSV